MASTFRSLVTFGLLLAFCQIALGGVSRQTLSNKIVRDVRPIARDIPVPETRLMPEEFVILQDSIETLNVLSNDNLYRVDEATLSVLTQPLHGIARKVGNQISYQPDNGFSGWDSFEYSVCNMDGDCSFTATTVVYVAPVSQAPTAVNDVAYLADAPNSLSIDVLSNDYDVDGPFANYASLAIMSQPQHGVALVSGNQIIYTPVWTNDKRFVGVDAFYYQICDENVSGLCSFASVSVTVTEVCVACRGCSDFEMAFQDQIQSIQSIFATTVLGSSS